MLEVLCASLMGVPLYVSSAVCNRSRRPGSAWSSDAEDENVRPKNAADMPQQAMKSRPVSARPRLMTAAQPPLLEPGVTLSAQPPASKHPRGARATQRPASAGPASTRSVRVCPASVRPPSLRPASAATTVLREQPVGTRPWQTTYRPVSSRGCSVCHTGVRFYWHSVLHTHLIRHLGPQVKEPWATMVPASRVSSARPPSSHAATARVDCGQRSANALDPREVMNSLEHEVAGLVRVVALERERAAAGSKPSAPDITSLACYSKVFLQLIDRCVALRPLLSRIKDAYDDVANGQIRQLQEGAAKITRSKTGVDRATGPSSLDLLATSENPSDGRFAVELGALQSILDTAHTRADAARETAMEKRRILHAKRKELCELMHSCERLRDTVQALQSTQNRVVASLRNIQDRRMGDDEHHTSGYWLKRKSADTKIQITEMRNQLRREETDRQNTEAKIQEMLQRKAELQEECTETAESIEKWRIEIASVNTRRVKTEQTFSDYKRSVGPVTPRPEWQRVEKDLMYGSFADSVNVPGNNDEFAMYRRTYGADPLQVDVNQKSSTLAMQIAKHVSELRAHVVDTQRQLADAEAMKQQKKEDEQWLQAVIEEEQAAVAARSQAKKFFVLEGYGPNVPIYMRGTGKVRDLAMSKAEAEEIIKNVWDTKIRSDSRKGAKKLELGVFLAGWMKTTYGVLALEKTYNLVDALKRFQYDADCALFHLVLKGEVCEEVYIEETRMIGRFMQALAAEDRKWSNAVLNKKIRRHEFLQTLESHFRTKKTPDEIFALKRALGYDQPTT